jgi:predicted acetyltransferase
MSRKVITMIRPAVDRDTSQIIDLWQYCFDDSPEFIDFFFQHCFQPENTLVAEDKGRIQSCLQLLPYRVFLRDKEVDIPYIVGVSTWPEYRGRGLIKQLLQYTNRVLRERNMDLSVLLPFQYDFYRKYGWEICYEFLTYRDVEIPSQLSLMSEIAEPPAQGRFARIIPDRDLDRLAACYFGFMKYYHGYIIRSRKDWMKILRDTELDNGSCYLYEEGTELLGYILYTIQDKTLTIKELIYITPEAKSALLQLAVSHKGQVERIVRKAPSRDIEYISMGDSRGKLDKETFVMGRIHNVTGALSGIPYTGKPFVMRVKDDFYNNNNGNFLIEQTHGITNVTKTNQATEDVCIGIHTLSQLLWGFLPPETACSEGLLRCGGKETAQSIFDLFPPKYNYMTEDY